MSFVNRSYWDHAVIDRRVEDREIVDVFVIDPGQDSGWVFLRCPLEDIVKHGSSVVAYVIENMGMRSSEISIGTEHGFAFGEINSVHKEGYLRGEMIASAMLIRQMQSCFGHHKPHLKFLILEDFILRERTKSRKLLSPVRLTSLLYDHLYIVNDFRLRDLSLHFQSPNDISIITDQQLEDSGCWFVGKDDARSAARHLLIFLRRLEIK